MKIIIISPVRNESKYISVTYESMIAQTLLPLKWIIVNDGSSDNTEELILNYKKECPFIEYIFRKDRGYRKPAQGVIESFYEGYNSIKNLEYDIVSKFDGDLQFPPETLETISQAFQQNSRLGITGGTRYEQYKKGQPFKKVLVPRGFVGGPFKFYRKQCFEDIGGLITRAGWDGVDTIKANMKGWETGELESVKISHLKPTGTAKGEGLIRAAQKYGDVSYYMGGYLWYFLLRVIGRSIQSMEPRLGYHMLKGYLNSRKKKQRESLEFRKFLKKKQMKNLYEWIGIFIHRND